ncbi:hypothetical protein GQ42DRAFT_51281 [Ramicandelaber brevisporus]|nr:hypothetical protein GQ42DRAFT_51281 [Ramicandelaber brevisporus]
MSSSGVKSLLHIVGWLFLPSLVTDYVVSFWFSLERDPARRSVRGSPRYARTWRITFVLLMLMYLTYTLVDTYMSMPSNFYAMFGLSPHDPIDERYLRRTFKRLSLLYHPDRQYANDDTSAADGGQQFVLLRLAYETLADPVRRFAYDRFGSSFLSYQAHVVSRRDYIYAALPSFIGTCIGNLFIISLLGFFGGSNTGGWFWRLSILAATACIELHLYTHPASTLAELITLLLPSCTLHEALIMLREVGMALLVGMAQIGPVLKASSSQDEGESAAAKLAKALAASDSTNRILMAECRRTLEPFTSDASDIERVAQRTKARFEEINVNADDAVEPIINAARQAASLVAN